MIHYRWINELLGIAADSCTMILDSRTLLLVSAIAAMATVVACSFSEVGPVIPIEPIGKETVTVTKHAVASVLITGSIESTDDEIGMIRLPSTAIVVDRGESIVLSAEAFGVRGTSLDTIEFVWSMVDWRAGAITRRGEFKAGEIPGIYSDAISVTGVQNTSAGVRYAVAKASVTVVGEVEPVRLSRVVVLPERLAVLTGQIYRLRAVGFDEDGLVIPAVNFAWRVNDPSLGRISDIGYLTVEGREAVFDNAVTVTGNWDGQSVSESIDVVVVSTPLLKQSVIVQILPQRFHLDPENSLQMRAVALNGLGDLVAGAVLRWSVEDERAGTVTGDGMFVAGAVPGIYTEALKVEAIVPRESGSVRVIDFASVVVRDQVQLSSPPLESVRVYPQSVVVIPPGGRRVIFAQAMDKKGRPTSDTSLFWDTLIKEAGDIYANGAFVASDYPGVYPAALKVVARQRFDGQEISATAVVDVTVTGTVTDVTISPPLATIATGRTVHFDLTAWDENGIELPGLLVRWRLSDEAIGLIDPSGIFTAGDKPGLFENSIMAEVIQTLPKSE